MKPGQWRYMPTPDEGQEAWTVFSSNGRHVASSDCESNAWLLASEYQGEKIGGLKQQGYTVQPVTIFKKEEG